MNLPTPEQIKNQASSLRDRAQALYSRGHYRVAAETASRAVALDGSPENHKMHACALLMSGDFPSAVKAYRATTNAVRH